MMFQGRTVIFPVGPVIRMWYVVIQKMLIKTRNIGRKSKFWRESVKTFWVKNRFFFRK